MGRGQKLAITVTDENGVAVASARVQLQPAASAVPVRCETDFVGRCEFTNLAAGAYELGVEKIGYYAISENEVQVGATAAVTPEAPPSRKPAGMSLPMA